jgi:DNA-binding SARP family transcriptional activator/tetratricopeptide (TPR) repeat protein
MRSPTSSLRVRLLGPLEVTVAGRAVVVDTRKALAIVALLAAEGRPFAREELAAMFWPEADDDAARGALRRTLSALRAAVDDAALRIDRARVALDPGVAWVDLTDLQRLAATSRPKDLEAAAALARGPFLAGFALRDSPAFDDWQAARAVRVEQVVGDLFERLAAARLARGDLPGAVEAARHRVDLDPLDEDGQRRLIEILASTGDRGGAIEQYRSLVALFDRELGVPPLSETTALYDAIREGRIAPAATVGTQAATARSTAEQLVEAATVVGTPVAAPRRAAIATLAGRTDELARLIGAWQASTTDGRLGIVEGEAGIGKTRLAEALTARATASGGTVVASRGYPGERAIPYGPIAELLRAGIALPDAPRRLAALDETVRLEIGRLVEVPAAIRVAGGSVSDSPSARVRLLDGIVRALAALVEGRVPGVIWIDDLHLADESTREAAAYLARRLAGRPLLLLLAWRREDLPVSALAVADDLSRIPDATVVSLGRLDRAAIAEIVAAAAAAGGGATAAGDAATRDAGTLDHATDALFAESEGVPLLVTEALAAGDPTGSGLRQGVEAMLRERIASVSETAGQVVTAAAVIGRSFDLATVRVASGRSEDETVEALEELTRRGLVREIPGSVGGPIRYDFVHRRLRDSAYEATSQARRRLLHRRTADALRQDSSGGGREDVGRYALIAVHEREAGRVDRAAAAYLEAAERAEAVFANREAIENLEAALALDPSGAAAAHERVGELHARLGEYPAAIAALETAAALAGHDDLPRIEVGLARVHRRRGDLAAAESHLASALGAPTSVTDALRAAGLIELSLVALRRGDLDAAEAAALDAGRASDRAGDHHRAGVSERLLGLVAQARGDVSAARAALERSLALAADDPDPTASVAASTALALTLAAAGSVDEAIAMATTAVKTCRRIGDRHLEAAVENHVADICHDAGFVEESMSHLKRAVALFAEIGGGAPEPEPGIWALAAW